MTSLPLRSVAADSNVLLAAIARRAASRVFTEVPDLVVVTTEANIAEVEEYLPEFAERYGVDPASLREALEILPIECYSQSDTPLILPRRVAIFPRAIRTMSISPLSS